MTEPQIAFDSNVEFRVNQDKRTISGMVVPWNDVAKDSAGMSKWRFAKNSLRTADIGRVKLNLHHDRTQAVGRAVRLNSTSQGLDGTFAIARGEEGDRALSLAEDGVLDGFSIEPHFEDDDGWHTDPDDRSVRVVTKARLSMVALVPAPAYDSARVTAVNLQEEKDLEMSEEKNAIESTDEMGEKEDKAHETQEFSLKDALNLITEKNAELTKDVAASVGEAVGDKFTQILQSEDEKRGTVKASRWIQTSEAPVYQMNGGTNSLVKDVWYAQKEQDEEAKDRIRKFQSQQREMSKVAAAHLEFGNPQVNPNFTAVDTTTGADVIPPGYRPDLFVPQLAQDRPLADLLSQGSIANATPFVVPQFGSVTTALTGDHTEGSPPTEGTIVLGQRTVNPVAVSGKLPLTREIVDSANPAIDQIVLMALREDYARQTEAKVYTELDLNSTDSDTVFTAASAVQDIRSELAVYPFTRFARPTGGALSQAGVSAVASAVDGADRPLIPAVGAQNAYGTTNATAGAWPIDGIGFVPAWSATGGEDAAEVLIVNRADAFVWESPTLTFRFEEKQGPEIIEMALFGYFATAVLRASGIIAINTNAAA